MIVGQIGGAGPATGAAPTRRGPEGGLERMLDQLSDEQRQEVDQGIEALKAEGASRREIGDYLKATFEELGVEPLDRPRGGASLQGAPPPPPPGAELPQDIRAQLLAGLEDLHEADSAPQEVLSWLENQLAELGVAFPPEPGLLVSERA